MTSIVKKHFAAGAINKPRGWSIAGIMVFIASTNGRRAALERRISRHQSRIWKPLVRLRLPRGLSTVCISLLVLVSVAVQATALAAQPFAELNERAIDDYVLPGFEKLESATSKLATSLGEVCERSAGQLIAVRDHFKQTVLAWAGVDFLRLGPMGEDARAERFNFSPDPRRTVERQLRKLLVRRDAEVLAPELLAKKSVAVQGLPALEVLLTSKKNSILSDNEDGRYRCRLAHSIAINLETIARETVLGWSGTNGWREKMLDPDADNAQYKSSTEAAAALVRALVTGLQLIQDRQIMPMIVAQSKPGRTLRLPFLHAGLSAAYFERSIKSCKRFYLAMNLSDYIPATEDWMNPWIMGAFHRSAREGPAAVRSFADGQKHLDRERNLRFLRFQVEGIRKLIERKIAPVAALTIGFNELDGD